MKKQKQKPWSGVRSIILLVGLGAMVYLLGDISPGPGTASAAVGTVERRVNIPYLGAGPPVEFFEPAIFWFGQVTPTVNNTDVRLWYYDEYMKVTMHIIDRRIWYDQSTPPAALEEWDAVTLFLNLDGNTGSSPTPASYRLVSQAQWGEVSENYKVSYRGDGSAWAEAPLSFTVHSVWRGHENDAINDKGWQVTFVIPFASLGLSERPAQDTEWGLAIAVHDRDEAAGNPPIADQVWPEMADTNVPGTWGVMNFGNPVYNWPVGQQQGTTTVRQGLNGAEVVDGHVGGHGNCGAGLDHWSEWGEKNYAGYDTINIQNQWDISDYPCFSKYFVTFPLDTMPPGKIILKATLTMNRFSNAGGGEYDDPFDSHIQAATVAEDWDEQTLNWNNAPLALENISSTWVQPVQTSEEKFYNWDVSRAVADAYQNGELLRLALYSTDGERHSGKYFMSSENNWDEAGRPTLRVIWGVPCSAPGVDCQFTYLPVISR